MNKGKISAVVMGAALVITVPFITDLEGEKLESYQDVANVWTLCSGETLNVKPGQKMTAEACRELTKSRTAQFMQGVANRLTVQLPPRTLAAHTSFAYNVGLGGYGSSQVLKLTNAGDAFAGCNAMINWHSISQTNKITGKRVKYDCTLPVNRKNVVGCNGLMNRRGKEIQMCLSGLAR